MAEMLPICYEAVIADTFNDGEVSRLFKGIQKGVTELVPSTILSDDVKEEIWMNSTTRTKAVHLMKTVGDH